MISSASLIRGPRRFNKGKGNVSRETVSRPVPLCAAHDGHCAAASGKHQRGTLAGCASRPGGAACALLDQERASNRATGWRHAAQRRGKNSHTALGLLLLERGADVNHKNLAGVTPLMSAAYNGDLELVRALLRRKADLAPVDRMKKTAVLYAAANGHAEVLSALLEHGADVNARYDNELTALMWAAGFGRDDAVKLLLARGAERNARDNRGKTALAIAEEEGRRATAELLRAAGAQQ
jgi:ankyrin repeat protein